MSESQPKARLPIFSAVCSTADESVFCISTSAPPLISAVAASVSFGGLNHSLTHTTLVVIFGMTNCAPGAKLLMLRAPLGDGDGADHAQRVGLAHLAGDHAGHIRALVSTAVVGAHIRGGLVASGVLEAHVLEVGGNLAISVFEAMRDAVASAMPTSQLVKLTAPATPENVLRALGN